MNEPDVGTVVDQLGEQNLGTGTVGTVAPFFITGCPRSGTTLLQVMLNRHPQIYIPPELKLFFAYHRLSRRVRLKTLDRIRQDLQITLSLPRAAMSSTAEVYAEIQHEIQDQQGPVMLGDKTPEYAYRLRWLREVYPSGKLIFVVRDPRDVALSLCRAPWLHCDVVAAAQIWNRAQRLMHASVAWRSGSVYWLRYEQLVSSPETVLREVLEFLGFKDLEPVSRMVAPRPDDSLAIPQRELGWKSGALDALDVTRIDRWKHHSDAEVRAIESQCYEELCRAGYQPHFSQHPGSSLTRLRGKVSLGRTALALPLDCWLSEWVYRRS